MKLLQDVLGNLPRTVLVLLILAIASAVVWRTFQSSRKRAIGINEGLFKARPLLLVVFGALCAVCMWPVVMGLRESSPISDGLDVFLLLNVLPRLVFFGIAAFFGFALFILQRSYVRVTPEAVEYADGWHKLRRVARNEILSADVRHPGAILVVQCKAKENNLTLPLLAYSRASLLAALLQRSAMRG